MMCVANYLVGLTNLAIFRTLLKRRLGMKTGGARQEKDRIVVVALCVCACGGGMLYGGNHRFNECGEVLMMCELYIVLQSLLARFSETPRRQELQRTSNKLQLLSSTPHSFLLSLPINQHEARHCRPPCRICRRIRSCTKRKDLHCSSSQ